MSKQGAPIEGLEEMKQAIALIRLGSKPHRCRIANQTLTYENPDVQSLKIAVEQYEKMPSAQAVLLIATALENCKSHGLETYSYKEIEALIGSTGQLTEKQATKNKM